MQSDNRRINTPFSNSRLIPPPSPPLALSIAPFNDFWPAYGIDPPPPPPPCSIRSIGQHQIALAAAPLLIVNPIANGSQHRPNKTF